MNWPLQVLLKLFKPASDGCDWLNDLARIQGIGNQNKAKKKKKKKTQISIHHNDIIIQHLIWLLIIGCAVIEMEKIYSGHSVTVKSFMCYERVCKLSGLKDFLTAFSPEEFSNTILGSISYFKHFLRM